MVQNRSSEVRKQGGKSVFNAFSGSREENFIEVGLYDVFIHSQCVDSGWQRPLKKQTEA